MFSLLSLASRNSLQSDLVAAFVCSARSKGVDNLKCSVRDLSAEISLLENRISVSISILWCLGDFKMAEKKAMFFPAFSNFSK